MLFGIRFYSQGQPGTPFQGAWLQRMRRAFSSVPGAGVAANLYSEARALRKSKCFQILFLQERCHTTPSRGDSPQPSHLVRDRDEWCFKITPKQLVVAIRRWNWRHPPRGENGALIAPHGTSAYLSLRISLTLEHPNWVLPVTFFSCWLWPPWWPTQWPSGVHHGSRSDHIRGSDSIPL